MSGGNPEELPVQARLGEAELAPGGIPERISGRRVGGERRAGEKRRWLRWATAGRGLWTLRNRAAGAARAGQGRAARGWRKPEEESDSKADEG